MIQLSDIQAALDRIRADIRISPCTHSETFSGLTNNSIFLKLDNQQRTGAFKERGALNKLLTLNQEERARGVIAASAGNHAQGVAYHAGRHKIQRASSCHCPRRSPKFPPRAPMAPKSCCTAPTTTKPTKRPSSKASTTASP